MTIPHLLQKHILLIGVNKRIIKSYIIKYNFIYMEKITLNKLYNDVIQEFDKRKLKSERRKKELEKIREYIQGNFKGNLACLKDMDKQTFKANYAEYRKKEKLNSAESSAINTVYEIFLILSSKNISTEDNQNELLICDNKEHIISEKKKNKQTKDKKDRDEFYVIRLCNEVLGVEASQQHKFDFLRGDGNPGRPLPVDAYYEKFNLVIEYYERQHSESVPFFDNKNTVSGVSRGVQRKIYDERRKTVLPQHGIKVVIISYSDFGDSKKIKRDHNRDIEVVRRKLDGII